jgi:hypothetical protein
MRTLLFVCCMGLALSCSVKVDPNAGRYSCEINRDCGTGFECRLQAKGGGLCFKVGQCKEGDICDGADEDCDGVVDNKYPEADAGCSSGLPGPCIAGNTVCSMGTLVCAQRVFPMTEACNGVDDNCNGMVDETFDFTSNASHCGRCGRVCEQGTNCQQSTCKESTCDDGTDNDSNGKTDCNDDACFQQTCATTPAPTRSCGKIVPRPDAGPVDAGPNADAGETDGGVLDAGMLDDDGGIDSGVSDAGAPDASVVDAGAFDAGLVIGCFQPEIICNDGYDNDGDFRTDCADTNCEGQACGVAKVCSAGVCQ